MAKEIVVITPEVSPREKKQLLGHLPKVKVNKINDLDAYYGLEEVVGVEGTLKERDLQWYFYPDVPVILRVRESNVKVTELLFSDVEFEVLEGGSNDR